MIKAKKSLSQNFLFDNNIRSKIIELSNIKNELILEIGPGYGFLTESILKQKPKKLYLIEKDYKLLQLLKEKYKNDSRVIFIEKDIFKINLHDFNNLKIISNLPYNISTKVILYLFNFSENISEMILMVQKEVAEKFDYNLPKMNKYKFITNIVSEFERCFNVSPNVFFPKPKVKSTVVRFVFNKKNFDLVKAKLFCNYVFKNIRKKIYNNLKIKNQNKLLNKRVSQLSIDDILNIYNFF